MLFIVCRNDYRKFYHACRANDFENSKVLNLLVIDIVINNFIFEFLNEKIL